MKQRFDPPSQAGRLAVITGTGGLGFECARALLQSGARVVLAGRNKVKGLEAVAALTETAPGAVATFELLDLASLESIGDFAARMISRGEPIDLLINNAGIMSPPQREETVDGHELQFGINYLGHFALTMWLLPLLAAQPDARVVSVTSLAQHYAKLDMDDLQSLNAYHAGLAYCASKLLQAIFAVELQRRSDAAGWGIASLAAHPGFAGTNLFETGGGLSKFVSTRIILPLLGQSAADGALPLLFAATAPDARGGRLYGPKGFMGMKGQPGECKFASEVSDTKLATVLWERSEDLIAAGGFDRAYGGQVTSRS